MTSVTAWGRLDRSPHQVVDLVRRDRAAAMLVGHRPGIPHGMGRSYGDQSLNPGGTVWRTTGLDRFIAFDSASGVLRCEAGVLLQDIQRLGVGLGWMLPVTPGTQLVTVGGAIANDVHGKNHHVRGSFGDHVRRLTLLRTDGEQIECGPALRADWFAATVGGAGLTGLILEAELQLVRVDGPWLDTETIPFASLADFFALAQTSEAGWEHSVAWIDALSSRGRGIFSRARPAVGAADAPAPVGRGLRFPFEVPVSLVNPLSLRLFNSAYYRRQTALAGAQKRHYGNYFYPLDGLADWNRMYGPRGFYQYQCVLPPGDSEAAVGAMMGEIARSGDGSFLAVLKTFGTRSAPGMLSFPRPGVTLAIDFPNRGARTLALFERLDRLLIETGGRLYLAKDARMSRAVFEQGYPRLNEFLAFRDPGVVSAMSRRLMGD